MHVPLPDPEFQSLARTRYASDPAALSALAARVLVGRNAPCSPADGEALFTAAAQQGSAEAWWYLSILAAAGVVRVQSWADAFDALARAAALGHPPAQRQQQVLAALNLNTAKDVAPWLDVRETRVLHDTPRLVAHAGFLPLALCKYLIEQSRPRLIRAQVFDARAGGLKTDPMRTNTGAAYSLIDTDLVMQLVRARIARATGVARDALEPTEVLHYFKSETYRPHVDFFHPSLPNYAEEMRLRGQRIRTCLVYLNSGYVGGETEFPKLSIKFRGEVGEALVFDNVGADGAGLMQTVHAGLPPASGEKWLLSQWIRDRAQPIA
jgi:prolyl 4-hydroxylase